MLGAIRSPEVIMAAHVDGPILPDLLYRYRRIGTPHELAQELGAIKEQYVWCSRYKALNDPMEGFFEPTSRLQKNTTYARIARSILDAKQDTGICCFSDTFTNELMWTHYANNYSGICVGYRTRQLIDGLPNHVHLVRLAYDGAPPKLGEADAKNPHAAALRVLSHKKANWLYEREWRLLGAVHGRLDIASKGCVREVYLGARISDGHKHQILAALNDQVIRISTMTVSQYEHKWELVKRLK